MYYILNNWNNTLSFHEFSCCTEIALESCLYEIILHFILHFTINFSKTLKKASMLEFMHNVYLVFVHFPLKINISKINCCREL